MRKCPYRKHIVTETDGSSYEFFLDCSKDCMAYHETMRQVLGKLNVGWEWQSTPDCRMMGKEGS